jgi:hypothetical protein
MKLMVLRFDSSFSLKWLKMLFVSRMCMLGLTKGTKEKYEIDPWGDGHWIAFGDLVQLARFRFSSTRGI